MVYYSLLIALFQIGWASSQIAHLSLIPELSCLEGERVLLNSIRYAGTIGASVAVFLGAWLLLRGNGSSGNENSVGTGDRWHFAFLAYGAVGLGLLFSLVFHVGTKEPVHESKMHRSTLGGKKLVKWQDWFKRPLFYEVGAIYMCARLVTNVTQVYIPLYVMKTLFMSKQTIASVPLVVFLAGFLTTIVLKNVNKWFGRSLTFVIGCLLLWGTCAWCFFLPVELANTVYGLAVVLGVGTTTVMVTSFSMAADLIGKDVECGAFVYGALSFCDKLSNGAAIMLIQNLPKSSTHAGEFYRLVMTYVTGGTTTVALLVLIIALICGHLALRPLPPEKDTHDAPPAETDPILKVSENPLFSPSVNDSRDVSRVEEPLLSESIADRLATLTRGDTLDTTASTV